MENTDSRDIVLVTCTAWPTLSRSDTLLADELTKRGHRVRSRPWNGAPLTEFTSADLVVLRSNWDYHHNLNAFEEWLEAVERSDAELHNPIGLVRAFLDKSYLADLTGSGFRTPKTMVTADFDLDAVMAWIGAHQLDRVVVKPAWGASGHGVALVRPDELSSLAGDWRADPDARPMLLQEFVPQVRNGEVALVFFAGTFSHALLRQAAPGEFRVNSQYGGSMALLADVDPDLVAFGEKVEATLTERTTYVRLDVVSDGVEHIVMEIEVNEPALGLDLVPESAARFADALLD